MLLFVFYRGPSPASSTASSTADCPRPGSRWSRTSSTWAGTASPASPRTGYAAGAFAVTAIFILRVPLTGFAHPLFTSMTGIGHRHRGPVAAAGGTGGRPAGRPARRDGAARVVEPHGHAGAARPVLSSCTATSRVFMPIFFGMLGLVLWVRSWEGRLAERVLPVYAAGRLVLPAGGGRAGHAGPAAVRPDLGPPGGRRRRPHRHARLPVRRHPARTAPRRPQPGSVPVAAGPGRTPRHEERRAPGGDRRVPPGLRGP